jgi:simple sugar transport system permease protein
VIPFLRRVGRYFLVSREVGPLVGLVIMDLIFQLRSGVFFTGNNFTGLSTIASSVGIVGIGVTFLMIAGEFDLSVGGMFAFAPIVMGKLIVEHGINEWLAFLLCLVIAAAIGSVNGLVTLRLGIPSFITTLGSLFILNGVNLILTGGQQVEFFGKSTLFPVLGGQLGTSPVYASLLWLLFFAVVFWFVLQRTRYGNWTFASGGRGGIARAVGVPVYRVKLLNFSLASILAAFAGCTQFAYLGSVVSGQGDKMELYAIVVAVVGGTSLFGVTGTIIGTVIGALVLGSLETGLVLIGAPGSLYTSLIGLILIVAVVINVRLDHLNIRLMRAPRG